jgi:1-acyl-sn-glycerol-3-phosphate acyltransferase
MHTIYQLTKICAIGLVTALCAIWGTLLLPMGTSYALYTATQTWSRLLFEICGLDLQVGNTQHIDWNKSRIFVANHQSHVDIPVLLYALPVALYFIAKKELKHIPFLGWYMQLVGIIFIDRSNKERSAQSMELAAYQIKRGRNVISFPEGTRSTDGDIHTFKRGSFKMAIAHDIEIVPIAIVGAERIIPARSFDIFPGKVHIEIGEPISPYGWENPDELAEFTRQKVISLHALGEAKLNNQQESPALFI